MGDRLSGSIVGGDDHQLFAGLIVGCNGVAATAADDGHSLADVSGILGQNEILGIDLTDQESRGAAGSRGP